MEAKKLCDLAREAAKKAYAPYSGFCVGAALLCDDGSVFVGCNIENASFSPTVCAERVAVFKAVSEGKRAFSAIAVAGGKNGEITAECPPCGVCRQVLGEFCSPDMPVFLVTRDGYTKRTLGELLPFGFGNGFLH